MWRELLELKDFRERQALTALQRGRSELAQAQAALERALARLQQHRELARTHERSLYDGLMRRTVRLRDIEDVQQSVSALRQAEQRLQLESEQAEGSRGQAQQATRVALDVHHATGAKEVCSWPACTTPSCGARPSAARTWKMEGFWPRCAATAKIGARARTRRDGPAAHR